MRVKQYFSAARQRGFLSSRQGLVLLILIFLAPAFVAWVMHNSTEQGWRPGGTTNMGTLVHPARPLKFPADLMQGEQPLNDYLQGLWTLVYIGGPACDAVCNGNLYKMRQIRIAQNENMRRVQRLYLAMGETLTDELGDLLAREYPDMAVATLTAAQADRLAPDFLIDGVSMHVAERVYIVDPLGNLMMYYAPDAEPGGMLEDLKKLLKYSKIG